MAYGKLLKPYVKGEGNASVVIKSVSGTSSYTSGGFTITIGELEYIEDAVVVANPSQLLEGDDTAYSISWSVNGNQITVIVKTLNVTGTSPVSWTEIADGTDLSSVTFYVVATGN